MGLRALVEILVVGVAACAAPAPSATPISVSQGDALLVEGDVPKPGPVAVEALGPKAADVEWSHRGESHRWRGVALEDVLAQSGFTASDAAAPASPAEKRAALRRVIVAVADDGYQAVFSAAEISASVGPTRAFLVWARDGEPLPKDMGRFRLVVPTDRDASRSMYRLTSLRVVDARTIVPPRIESGGARP